MEVFMNKYFAFIIVLMGSLCMNSHVNADGGGQEAEGGFAYYYSSGKLLKRAQLELVETLDFISPEDFTQQGLEKERFISIIKNLRENPTLSRSRKNPEGQDEELMFDYGQDDQGQYIEALATYYKSFAHVDVDNSIESIVSSTLKVIKLKIIHETAHCFSLSEDVARDVSRYLNNRVNDNLYYFVVQNVRDFFRSQNVVLQDGWRDQRISTYLQPSYKVGFLKMRLEERIFEEKRQRFYIVIPHIEFLTPNKLAERIMRATEVSPESLNPIYIVSQETDSLKARAIYQAIFIPFEALEYTSSAPDLNMPMPHFKEQSFFDNEDAMRHLVIHSLEDLGRWSVSFNSLYDFATLRDLYEYVLENARRFSPAKLATVERSAVIPLPELPSDVLEDHLMHIMRIGGVFHNMVKNSIRMKQGQGKPLSETDRFILDLEKRDDIAPNDIVVISRDLADRPTLTKIIITNPEGMGAATGYLASQALGTLELAVEDLGGYVCGGLMMTQPFGVLPGELNDAFENKTVFQRYADSGLVLWDTAKATAYAVVEIPVQLARGDIMRSIKAATRVPFELGHGLLHFTWKIIRLPIDIPMSIKRAFEKEENSKPISQEIPKVGYRESNISVDTSADGIAVTMGF